MILYYNFLYNYNSKLKQKLFKIQNMSVTFTKAQMEFLNEKFNTMSTDMVTKMLGSEEGYDEDEAFRTDFQVSSLLKDLRWLSLLKNTSDDEEDEDI